MEKGCRYNTCKICAFTEECAVFKENKIFGYEIKKLENELKFARDMAIKKHKEAKLLKEENKVLNCNLRG